MYAMISYAHCSTAVQQGQLVSAYSDVSDAVGHHVMSSGLVRGGYVTMLRTC